MDNYKDLLEHHKELTTHLIDMLQLKNEECNSYKLKLGEIQKVLNSEVKIYREGIIKQNENE